MSYEVRVSPLDPGRVTIEARMQGVPRGALQAYAPAKRFEGIEAWEVPPSGPPRPMPVRYPVQEEDSGFQVTPGFRPGDTTPVTLLLKYKVTPYPRERDAHWGVARVVSGCADPGFVFAAGKDLFITPVNASLDRDIRVRFTLPPSWAPVVPWAGDGRSFVPGVDGKRAAEALLRSPVALGIFREETFVAHGTNYRLACERGIPESARQLASGRIREIVRYLDGVLPRPLGPDYLVVLLPPSSTGQEVTGVSWSNGQGATLSPPTAERLNRLAENLIDAHLLDEPYRSEIVHPEEFWLLQGVRGLYSRRALVRVGLTTEDQVVRELAYRYQISVRRAKEDLNLETLYDRGVIHGSVRFRMAPLVLEALDQQLRQATGNTVTLDAVLARLFQERQARSLWSLLPSGQPERWADFRRRNVQNPDASLANALCPLNRTRNEASPDPVRQGRALTLVYSGRTFGYLESGGCKLNSSGGLPRRAGLIEQVRRTDRNVLLLDAGESFIRPGAFLSPDSLQDLEQRTSVRLLGLLRYDAVAIGETELSRGPAHFSEMTAGSATPYLSANLRVDGALRAPGMVRLERDGLRIAILGIFEPPTGMDALPQFADQAGRLEFDDPVETVRRQVAALGDGADLIVVLGRLTPPTIRTLVQRCPDVDVVVSTAYDAPLEPGAPGPAERELKDLDGFLGRTLVLYSDLEGFGVGVAKLRVDDHGGIASAERTVRFLDASVPESTPVRDEVNRFYRMAANTLVGATVTVSRPVRSGAGGRPGVVGDRACATCHPAQHADWSRTRHAVAYQSVLEWYRQFDPGCLTCHAGGALAADASTTFPIVARLRNVQCEACHGPGAEHARTPERSNIDRNVPAEVCLGCHDPAHSPGFDYALASRKVQHQSHPAPAAAGQDAARTKKDMDAAPRDASAVPPMLVPESARQIPGSP